MVAGFAQRRFDREGAGFAVHVNIHKTVECAWYLIGLDAMRSERCREIAEAAMMWVFMTVDDPKCVF